MFFGITLTNVVEHLEMIDKEKSEIHIILNNIEDMKRMDVDGVNHQQLLALSNKLKRVEEHFNERKDYLDMIIEGYQEMRKEVSHHLDNIEIELNKNE